MLRRVVVGAAAPAAPVALALWMPQRTLAPIAGRVAGRRHVERRENP